MKHLVFGPGAMGYFLYLGALSALQDSNALNELETIHGASAGGLAAFIYLVTKGDVRKALDYSVTIPIGTIMKPNIKTLLKSYGLVGSRKIHKVLEEITQTFMGRTTLTFAELYEYNPIKLYVTATCVDLHVTHYFSVDTTPQMSVFDALCMTVSIPFLFQSIRHGPWHYTDGGALEAVPCGMLVGEDPKTVLAFSVGGEWTPKGGIKDIKSYAISMIGAAMKLRHAYPHIPRIEIDPGSIDPFDFGASNDAKFRLFIRGYTVTKNSLCRVNGTDPACRVHAPIEAEADQRPIDASSQGVQLRASSIDGASQVYHDQELGEARKGAQDPASPTQRHADDVRLLDGGVPNISA